MIRISRSHAGDRMARFIEGADRRQAALLPESLDDYVGVARGDDIGEADRGQSGAAFAGGRL